MGNHTDDSFFICGTSARIYYIIVIDINIEIILIFSMCELKRNCKQQLAYIYHGWYMSHIIVTNN